MVYKFLNYVNVLPIKTSNYKTNSKKGLKEGEIFNP